MKLFFTTTFISVLCIYSLGATASEKYKGFTCEGSQNHHVPLGDFWDSMQLKVALISKTKAYVVVENDEHCFGDFQVVDLKVCPYIDNLTGFGNDFRGQAGRIGGNWCLAEVSPNNFGAITSLQFGTPGGMNCTSTVFDGLPISAYGDNPPSAEVCKKINSK